MDLTSPRNSLFIRRTFKPKSLAPRFFLYHERHIGLDLVLRFRLHLQALPAEQHGREDASFLNPKFKTIPVHLYAGHLVVLHCAIGPVESDLRDTNTPGSV